MHLLVVGMNHRTAPLADREALALAPEATRRVLVDTLQRDPIREALVISTCNRTEFYLAADDPDGAATALRASVERIKGRDLLSPGPSIYRFDGTAAIRHAFRVACGLDSMVLGEAQILSQLKDAYTVARDTGAAGATLDRLFESAFRAGKRARTETSIGAGVVSIASAACELARQGLQTLDTLRVVVVGAGETSRLAAKHLAHHCPGGVTIVNRTWSRAEELALELGITAKPLAHLADAIASADLVVTATTAPTAVIGAEDVRSAMAARPDRPLLIIDLAVPRDVEPEVATIAGVTLHPIDAIQTVVDRTLATRAGEVPRVEAIVDEEAAKYEAWRRGFEASPIVRDLRDHFERVRSEEVDRQLSNASAEERARAERLTKALVNRLLHLPTVRLKDADPASDEGGWRLRAARELFALDGGRADHGV
jgi:glutamyl-tRNA reductase